jgi:hypothetical protein
MCVRNVPIHDLHKFPPHLRNRLINHHNQSLVNGDMSYFLHSTCKKVNVLLYSKLPNFWNSTALRKVAGLRFFVLLVTAACRWRQRHWWNDTDIEKSKFSEKSLSQSHFVYNTSHMYQTGIEPGPRRTGRQLTAWAMAQPIISYMPGMLCLDCQLVPYSKHVLSTL